MNTIRQTQQELSNKNTQCENGESTQAVNLGGMQVEVQVEVARLLLPLSALQNLAVGQVFDTERPIDGNSVLLWVGGQRLATCQLVAIGERVGVRVLAIEGVPAQGVATSNEYLPHLNQTSD